MARVTAKQQSRCSGRRCRLQFLHSISVNGPPYCVLRIIMEASSCAAIPMKRLNALSQSQAGSFPALFWCPPALFRRSSLKNIFLLWWIRKLSLTAAVSATDGIQVTENAFRSRRPLMYRFLPPLATVPLQLISAIRLFPSTVSAPCENLNGEDKAAIVLALMAYNIGLNSER